MSHEIDRLHQLHRMCTMELEHLNVSINKFTQSSDRILEIIEAHWQKINDSDAIALIAYDIFLTSLTDVMDLGRKFNLHLQINDVETNSSKSLFKALQAVPTTIKAAPNEVQNTSTLQPSQQHLTNGDLTYSDSLHSFSKSTLHNESNFNECSIPPVEVSDNDNSALAANESGSSYVEKDISLYKPGDTIQASISHISDLSALHFFACDSNSPDVVQIQRLSHMVNLRQYTGLPPENEVFGIVLDELILRAIRKTSIAFAADESDNENERSMYSAFLLDFGENIEISAKDVMYHLLHEQQLMPAQAIFCQLHGISEHSNVTHSSLQKRLEELMYKKITLRILPNDSAILLVELVEEPTVTAAAVTAAPALDYKQFASTESNNKNPRKNTNPFVDSAQALPEIDESIAFDRLSPLSTIARDTFNPTEKLSNGLTAEQMEMLEEEPLCTTNAMKAVMGYDPKDEQRLCRFYDPKIRGCFKGVHCRHEHTPPQPEGWTKDVIPSATIFDTHIPIVRYANDSIISITPTHVGQVERFYAQVNDPNNPMEPLIWNREDIAPCDMLKKPPMLYEIVRVRYEDNLWYRAKVIEADDSSKLVKVFYVDYGNHQEVHLRDLARCNVEAARLPFQAVLCRIVDLKDATETPEQRKNAIKSLCNMILNETINVQVKSHEDDLIISFVDKCYKKKLATLVEKGWLKPCKTILL